MKSILTFSLAFCILCPLYNIALNACITIYFNYTVVIASCSNSTSPKDADNVVLTHYSTRAKLESFSNFQSADSSSQGASATSISFGGKSAKSRYLCVSDEGGSASVWDMKKISRVRCFKMKSLENNNSLRPSCVKCCMDPSDSYVVALHGDSSVMNRSNRIALELFHLKTGGRQAMLKTPEHAYGGGADCFEFSTSNNGQLLVGTRDGSLLLWDCSTSAIVANSDAHAPLSVLGKRHEQAVTDVAFSPANEVLAASCSTDGSVSFHDVDSNKTIQTISPWDHPVKFTNKIDDRDGKALTSIAFHHDGFTWAVGTKKGLVFTYDLRQTGAGPLCTMDVSGMNNHPINRLQFLNAKPSIGPTSTLASAVKRKVSLGGDGAVTVQREKTTPSRKEISKTTYSIQKDQPSISKSTRTDNGNTSSSIGASTMSSDGKPVSKRTEKITTRTTTTTKKITSPARAGVGSSSSFLSPPADTKVESTSTNEVTTSSSQQPSTTKRITKNKIITSSPNRAVTPTFRKDSIHGSSKGKKATVNNFNMNTSSSKRDPSVSFDDKKRHISFNDLTFGDNDSIANESSDSEAEQMMEDFDQMYERIKSRALSDKDEMPKRSPVKEYPPDIIRASADFSEIDKTTNSDGKMVIVSKVSSKY